MSILITLRDPRVQLRLAVYLCCYLYGLGGLIA
jgi:hypothetical protein